MKYLKRIMLLLCIVLCSVFSIKGICATYDEFTARKSNFRITVDNTDISYENPVITIDDVTYVPLRETFEKIGYNVEWCNAFINVYTKDLYDEIEIDGYIYHIMNEPVNLSKEKLLTDGLNREKFNNNEDEKRTDLFKNAEEAAMGFSNMLDETGDTGFKNKNYRYYDLYDAEDIWIINWQSKEMGDLIEYSQCYTMDKKTGVIECYIWKPWFFNNYIHYRYYDDPAYSDEWQTVKNNLFN